MNNYIKPKESIILSAIAIIDVLGFQGVSIKEICRHGDFLEETLYKHYGSKDEIILAVLDYYFKFDDDIKQTIAMQKFTAKKSIKFYVARFGEYYENYPAMTAIYNSYEVFRNESNLVRKINEIFEYRSSLIMQLLEEGVKSGEFSSTIDCENLSDIILGACREITLKWRMRNNNFKLKERLTSTVDMILKAYLRPG